MTKKITYPLFLLLLFACGNNTENQPTTESVISDAFLPNVQTAQVESRQLQQELTLTGRVTADPGRTIIHSPLVSGVIVQSHFTLGDRVRRGQRMLDIRSAELSELQSELAIAQRTLQSTQSLLESGMATELELVEARATLEKLQADLALFGESRSNGVFSITAPISGYVIEGERGTGSTFSEEDDTPLFVIADLSTVWVMANVHASDLPFVREGMEVGITTLSYPDRVFHGTIHSLSRVFDPEERVLRARIIMDNSDFKLIPEMFVLVTVKDRAAQYFPAIPSDALIFDDNRHFVVVETSHGNFEIRNVAVQGHNNYMSYIVEGLEEGDKVVVVNQLLIYSELRQR